MSTASNVFPAVSAYAIPGLKYKPPVGPMKPHLVTQIILETICDFYGLSKQTLVKRTRKREIVTSRQIACLLIKKFTKFSLKEIGEQISEPDEARDHTTVIHSINTVNDLIDTDPIIAEQVAHLIEAVETRYTLAHSVIHS